MKIHSHYVFLRNRNHIKLIVHLLVVKYGRNLLNRRSQGDSKLFSQETIKN